jgi:hypothetical protein
MPIAFVQMGSSMEYGSLKSPQKENAKCNTKFIKSTYGRWKFLQNIFQNKESLRLD